MQRCLKRCITISSQLASNAPFFKSGQLCPDLLNRWILPSLMCMCTYCPPRCSGAGWALPLLVSSAADERMRMPPLHCHPFSECALVARSDSSSLKDTTHTHTHTLLSKIMYILALSVFEFCAVCIYKMSYNTMPLSSSGQQLNFRTTISGHRTVPGDRKLIQSAWNNTSIKMLPSDG